MPTTEIMQVRLQCIDGLQVLRDEINY
jgi:hypothetical protein